jgi:large subunit ribosomal protein L18
MDQQKRKLKRQLRRRLHVRRRITGTAERPRLSVFRSSKHIYAQLIDDLHGVTLAGASSRAKDVRAGLPYGGNIKAAVEVGRRLAEAARQKGIDKAAFDRGHYRFHGRVKALAEAANEAGLKCCEPKPGKKRREPEPAASAPAKGKKPGGGKEKKAEQGKGQKAKV